MGEILETFTIGFIVMFTISLLFSFFRHQSDEDEPDTKSTPKTPSSSSSDNWWKDKSVPMKPQAAKVYHRHDVTWGAMNKPFDEYATGDEPSDSWFLRHNIDKVEFKLFLNESKLKMAALRYPKPVLKNYDKWVDERAFPKVITEVDRRQPITPTHSRETIQEEVTMYDFFAHPLYKEFETREGINLKDTKLEVLQIYKLFKAYLLLNHNIEITTKDL